MSNELGKKLFGAAENGKVEDVRNLFVQGAPVNWKNSEKVGNQNPKQICAKKQKTIDRMFAMSSRVVDSTRITGITVGPSSIDLTVSCDRSCNYRVD